MPLKRWLVLGALVVTCQGQAQTVINCSNFTTTGACGVSTSGGAETFWLGDGASLPSSPGPVSLIASGSTHTPGTLLSQALENVQAFNLTYTFVPNGQNISFFATNTNNNPGFNAPIFGGGAGCEGGFYPLHYASLSGSARAVKSLLEFGACVNVTDFEETTVM